MTKRISDTTTEWSLGVLKEMIDEYKDAFPDSMHTEKYELALERVTKRTMFDLPKDHVLSDLHNKFIDGRWYCRIERMNPYKVFYADNSNKGFDSPGEALSAAIEMAELYIVKGNSLN